MTGKIKHTPGPWVLCHHLQSIENDRGCHCGYRGVVYGPDAKAICQPGHSVTKGEEGLEPQRYEREVELANMRVVSVAPEMLEALKEARGWVDLASDMGRDNTRALAMIDAVIAKAEGQS